MWDQPAVSQVVLLQNSAAREAFAGLTRNSNINLWSDSEAMKNYKTYKIQLENTH